MTFLSDSVKNEETFKPKKTKKRSLKKSSLLFSDVVRFCVLRLRAVCYESCFI